MWRAPVPNVVHNGKSLTHFNHHKVVVWIDVCAAIGSHVDYIREVSPINQNMINLWFSLLRWSICVPIRETVLEVGTMYGHVLGWRWRVTNRLNFELEQIPGSSDLCSWSIEVCLILILFFSGNCNVLLENKAFSIGSLRWLCNLYSFWKKTIFPVMVVFAVKISRTSYLYLTNYSFYYFYVLQIP